MGDDDGGTVFQYQVKSFLYLRFGERVNAGRRLVEDDDGGVLEQDSRQSDELPLSHRERFAFFSHLRLEAVGQRLEPIAPADILSYRRYFLVRCLRAGIADVVGHCARKEERYLRHNAQAAMVGDRKSVV